MNRIIPLLALFALLCSCSGSSKHAAQEADTLTIDTVYSPTRTLELIDKAMGGGHAMTQTEYAEMIEQSRAINRCLVERLRATNFNADMSEEEIRAAIESLRADTVMTALESQSRKLLLLLQNADLDAANRDRYASMAADAESGLRSLH